MIKELENLVYFSTSNVDIFLKNRNLARVNISRRLKNGEIHHIREGIYISDKKINELKFSNKMGGFIEFIATNLIYKPSYISMEYVLFLHNIITENVYTMTLITTKKTAEFKNIFGKFYYNSIKESFFGDYETIKKDGFLIYRATPEKALFDYFYFKRGFIFKESYIRELRLNIDNINFKKFEKIVKKYNSPKVTKIFNLLKKYKGL
ncbi:MAG TPA: hypothetical protein VJ892_04515 [Candidatus Absconditabacterales bacterium]|nr:hypothetical protein [Candidatus Absconditabacterales bacterium]